MTHIVNTGRLARRMTALVSAAFLAGTTACSGLFDVEDPQAFGNEDLNNTAILSNPVPAAGDGLPAGSTLFVNAGQVANGRMGVTITAPTAFVQGSRQLITIRFDVAEIGRAHV